MDSNLIYVSVVIPCYNSARHVENRVKEFQYILENTKWTWEIVLCDDGSQDETPKICESLSKSVPHCRYIPSTTNRGRGRNAAEGMRKSRGKYTGFVDADFSTSAAYLIPILKALESGFEVAEANRNYKIQTLHLPFIFHRILAHVGYSSLVRFVLGLKGHDTETGFKFFRRDKLENLLDTTESWGWFWDTEVVANAHRLGYRVADIPTLFVRNRSMGSTVRLLGDSVKQFSSLMSYAAKNRFSRLTGSCCEKD